MDNYGWFIGFIIVVLGLAVVAAIAIYLCHRKKDSVRVIYDPSMLRDTIQYWNNLGDRLPYFEATVEGMEGMGSIEPKGDMENMKPIEALKFDDMMETQM